MSTADPNPKDLSPVFPDGSGLSEGFHLVPVRDPMPETPLPHRRRLSAMSDASGGVSSASEVGYEA